MAMDKDPTKLGGRFWSVSGFAAAKGGVSASFSSTGMLTDPAGTIGGGIGVGAGVAVQTGWSYYLGSFKF